MQEIITADFNQHGSTSCLMRSTPTWETWGCNWKSKRFYKTCSIHAVEGFKSSRALNFQFYIILIIILQIASLYRFSHSILRNWLIIVLNAVEVVLQRKICKYFSFENFRCIVFPKIWNLIVITLLIGLCSVYNKAFRAFLP